MAKVAFYKEMFWKSHYFANIKSVPPNISDSVNKSSLIFDQNLMPDFLNISPEEEVSNNRIAFQISMKTLSFDKIVQQKKTFH